MESDKGDCCKNIIKSKLRKEDKQMIAVAMTTYNGEKYVEKQLNSLLLQSRPADEVVITDDCSQDRTATIVKEFIAEHHLNNWYFFENKKNLGYKKNFYQSICKTNGDLIFLCDQDDEWERDKIKKMEIIFKRHRKILALNTTFSLIDRNDQPIEYHCHKGGYNNDLRRGKCREGQLKAISFDTIMRYNISPGCTMAFRKEIKDIFLKNSLSKLPHDWEINIIAANNDGLFFYNRPMIKYRIHEKNTLGMNTNDSISNLEFKQDVDFRRAALEERRLFKEAMDEWNEKLGVAEKKQRIYRKIIRYDALRMQCVYEYKLKAWFELVIQTLFLWDGKHVRFKTLFGDLFYALRKR